MGMGYGRMQGSNLWASPEVLRARRERPKFQFVALMDESTHDSTSTSTTTTSSTKEGGKEEGREGKTGLLTPESTPESGGGKKVVHALEEKTDEESKPKAGTDPDAFSYFSIPLAHERQQQRQQPQLAPPMQEKGVEETDVTPTSALCLSLTNTATSSTSTSVGTSESEYTEGSSTSASELNLGEEELSEIDLGENNTVDEVELRGEKVEEDEVEFEIEGVGECQSWSRSGSSSRRESPTSPRPPLPPSEPQQPQQPQQPNGKAMKLPHIIRLQALPSPALVPPSPFSLYTDSSDSSAVGMGMGGEESETDEGEQTDYSMEGKSRRGSTIGSVGGEWDEHTDWSVDVEGDEGHDVVKSSEMEGKEGADVRVNVKEVEVVAEVEVEEKEPEVKRMRGPPPRGRFSMGMGAMVGVEEKSGQAGGRVWKGRVGA